MSAFDLLNKFGARARSDDALCAMISPYVILSSLKPWNNISPHISKISSFQEYTLPDAIAEKPLEEFNQITVKMSQDGGRLTDRAFQIYDKMHTIMRITPEKHDIWKFIEQTTMDQGQAAVIHELAITLQAAIKEEASHINIHQQILRAKQDIILPRALRDGITQLEQEQDSALAKLEQEKNDMEQDRNDLNQQEEQTRTAIMHQKKVIEEETKLSHMKEKVDQISRELTTLLK